MMAVPGALLLWVIRRRTWSSRVLLLFPVAAGISLTTYRFFNRSSFVDSLAIGGSPGLLLLTVAIVGLPEVAFLAELLASSITLRWRRLLWLAAGTLLLSGGLAIAALAIDSRSMDSEQHYVWDNAWAIVGFGIYACGVVCLAGLVLGPPVKALWRLLKRK
jgi:hypothetical protein